MYKIYDKERYTKNVQIYLENLGQNKISIVQTGIYDVNTRLCVLDFQKHYNLSENGVIDKETLDLLYKEHLKKKAKRHFYEIGFPLPFYLGDFNESILWLNRAFMKLLNNYGRHHSLKANKFFSTETEEAARSLCKIYNINYPGYVDETLLTLILRDLESL